MMTGEERRLLVNLESSLTTLPSRINLAKSLYFSMLRSSSTSTRGRGKEPGPNVPENIGIFFCKRKDSSTPDYILRVFISEGNKIHGHIR